MNRRSSAHIALFSVAIIYGVNYIVAKDVMAADLLHPFSFVFLRVVFAGVLFWIFHALFVREVVDRKDIPLLVLCSLFGVAINQLGFFYGLDFTSPINAALLMTTSPVSVLLISYILVIEVLNLRKAAGILAGLTGAVVLILHQSGTFGISLGTIKGDLFVFINATAFAGFLVLAKPLLIKYNPVTVAKWLFFFGFFWVAPFGLTTIGSTPLEIFDTQAYLAILYVLLFTTFLAYLLNAYALGIVNPTTVSIYIYLQPVIATALSIALGKDQLTLVKAFSGLLIFTGVFLVSRERGGIRRRSDSGSGTN